MKKYALLLICAALFVLFCASCSPKETDTPRNSETVEKTPEPKDTPEEPTDEPTDESDKTSTGAPPRATPNDAPTRPTPPAPETPYVPEPGENMWTEYVFSDMHPIVYDGMLLGGSFGGGMWIGADSVAEYILGTELYTLYDDTGAYSNGFGGKVPLPVGYEPYTQFVEVREFAPVGMNDIHNVGLELPPGVLAISTNWDAMPRSAATQALKNDTYEQIVKDILAESGLKTNTVNILQHYRLDFEGDGVDEVVIYAESPAQGWRYEVSNGAYSLLIVRKIVSGGVKNFVLVKDVHLDAETYYQENGYFGLRTIAGICGFYDLNGDGKLELLIESSYYEGYGYLVYEINADGPALVLSNSIGA